MGLLDTTISCGTGSTITDSCQNGIHISGEEVATTLSSTISTATTSGLPRVYIYADTARGYVESMSEEELNDLLEQLDIAIGEDDSPKVKKL